MSTRPEDFWNKRFAESEYAYGTAPNAFFRSVIDTLKPGRIFVPGAGEGRDAVYAATLGWDVYCADMSEEAKSKALRLATEQGVKIDYQVAEISHVEYPFESFDLVASVFFHLPTQLRLRFHRSVYNWLKPGGLFVLQAFTPNQLQYASGGPKEIDLLLSAEQLRTEMKNFEIKHLVELETILDEGRYHQGKASLVEFIGQKK